MSPTRNIIKFGLLGGLYFCLMTVPWPGSWSGPAPHAMDAYRWVFRRVGNVLFARMGDGGSVRFSPLNRELHKPDTSLRVTNRRRNTGGSGEIKAIYMGYRPTAFLLALILATPIPWRRRGYALLWGGLLISVFVLGRTWIRLAAMMSNHDAIRAYEFSGWVKGLLDAFNAVLVRSPAVGYIIPALIWIIVALRHDAWSRFGIHLGLDESSPNVNHKPAPQPRAGG